MLDDNPSTVELSPEDEAWIGAIVDRVMFTFGWELERAEQEARRAVIEFYERGEKREIEEALRQKRESYRLETERLRAEAERHTWEENQLRQRNEWEREQQRTKAERLQYAREAEARTRAENLRLQYARERDQQRMDRENRRRQYEEQQNTAERRVRERSAKRTELARQQRAAWKSANGVGDEHGSTFDYSHSFYDAMVESASEHDDELIKGETIDTVVRWQASIYAPYFEVEWATKYEIEPEELEYGGTWQWLRIRHIGVLT